ncbi:hypothetical protein IBL26_08225 [Roseomonas aerophila]|uniref:Uncharacterized protein n=1 Tax=Teichococcus aerophilus TaxID=1224513 RepID=A0ABR7RJS2_9PROT|nr:hypothetical protein [Pseudoroseomonas aerophila]MBC9206820.1 hypothetical protein [Pseudoroseomonas aerophila]
MTLGRTVPLSMSDALLDMLWERHLRGAYLPQHVVARLTMRGPTIQIRSVCATYRWLRHPDTQNGGFWRITPSLV